MTESMRTRVEKAVRESNGALTIEFAKTAIAQKEKTISYWNSLEAWKQGYTAKCAVVAAEADIEYFEAVIAYLTEVAATERKAIIQKVEQNKNILSLRRLYTIADLEQRVCDDELCKTLDEKEQGIYSSIHGILECNKEK